MSKPSATHRFFLETWYNKRWWAWLLLPLSWMFTLLAWCLKKHKQRHAVQLAVPVVIVGNISVGGTGKTPVLIALAKALIDRSLKVGIISRGYGGEAPHYPYLVSPSDSAAMVGDEPLLVQRSTLAPVVVGSDRVAAAEYLLEQYPDTDIVLSDDGLQHYRLGRQVEIAVVDRARGLGNHLCLPAGPLREPASRLASVDWVLLNSGSETISPDPVSSDPSSSVQPVHLSPVAWLHIASQQRQPLAPLPWILEDERIRTTGPAKNITAIAGIGHPQRFFDTLQSIGIDAKTYAFDDHHAYTQEDLIQWKEDIVLMTEKDGVKCQPLMSDKLVPDNCWALVVEMQLPEALINSIAASCQAKKT